MPIPLAIPIAIAAAKTAYGFYSAHKQAGEERATLREQLRRMRLENERVLGQTAALGASDEFGLSGSLPAYIQKMGAEMSRQMDWTRQNGLRASSLNNASSIFGTATDFGGSLIRIGEQNKWWQK